MKIINKNYIFFLGGYDAEMHEIKEIFTSYNLTFFDKNLSWGAKASEYKNEIENLRENEIPVLIELTIDISLPENSVIIDHHNENETKPSSIEQIAELLGIELNRWQKLISANDKAYIDGMLELNATDDEIKEIRKLDRKCQGVTDEDEKNAEISVKHFSERLTKNCILIESLTERTSPITDSLYGKFKHIFIITPSNELNYFGSGEIVQMLIGNYSEKKKKNPKIDFWFGGNLPADGFFGSNFSLTQKEILELSRLTGEGLRIHSQHIFMFPFTINSEELEKANSALEKLKLIHKRLIPDNSGWKYKPFKKSSIDNDIKKYSKNDVWAYNEYMYFHEYVRETIFNETPEDKLFDESNKQSAISLYYERECDINDEMMIRVKSNTRSEEYMLSVDHLSLRIFETGVGILSITLYNYCRTDLEAILKINDFGRRIYPQFLGEQTETQEPIDAPKDNFFLDEILFNVHSIREENRKQFFRTEDFIYKKDQYARYIQELLTPINSTIDNVQYNCIPIIDDRMFTICWYENTDLVSLLKKFDDETKSFRYENSRDWYMYVFIDGKSAGIGNYNMRNKLISGTSYTRFVEDWTLFGLTRYSFVCLCGKDPYKDFTYQVIRNHMQKMYYQMAILLLAQRASIISFNLRLERLSAELRSILFNPDKKKNEKDAFKSILKKMELLNLNVLNFRNRIAFDEITPQDQGIELYQLAQKNMEISQQLDSLSKRMETLHLTVDQIYERMDLEEERNRNEIQRERKKLFDKITLLAAIFAPLTLYFTLTKFVKPFIVVPTWLSYGIIPEIFFPLWSALFLLTVFLLFYCLINDDYSEKLGYKTNWFSPFKALMQQFFFLRSEPKLFRWKILLLAYSSLLFILSLQTAIDLVSTIIFYLRYTWQLLQ